MSCLPYLNTTAGKYSTWATLAEEIRHVDLALNITPEEIPDKCKSICESVLKEVLVRSGENTEEEVDAMDMHRLKVSVSHVLQFDSAEDLLVKGEIDYIARNRNSSGVAGHGRSLQRQSALRSAVDSDRNQRTLSITDSLLTLLITQYQRRFPEGDDEATVRDDDYDAYIDELYGTIVIVSEEYGASEILHALNPIEYAKGLQEFKKEENEEEDVVTDTLNKPN